MNDALTERIARTVHMMQGRIMPWDDESEVYRKEARDIAIAILPIIFDEVKSSKAEVIREAANMYRVSFIHPSGYKVPVVTVGSLMDFADELEEGV